MQEERTCQHNRKSRWRRCKQHQRRGHRQKFDKFHVIQVILPIVFLKTEFNMSSETFLLGNYLRINRLILDA